MVQYCKENNLYITQIRVIPTYGMGMYQYENKTQAVIYTCAIRYNTSYLYNASCSTEDCT